jgi:hypothetical protein
MSAGDRNLDGMPDGRSGSVRQCLRQVRSCSPRGGRGGHADRTPTMVTWLGRGRGLRWQWFRACVRLSAAVVAMSAAATQGPLRVRSGGRRTDTRPRRPIAADISVATDQPVRMCRTPTVRTPVVPEAADGQSADRLRLWRITCPVCREEA